MLIEPLRLKYEHCVEDLKKQADEDCDNPMVDVWDLDGEEYGEIDYGVERDRNREKIREELDLPVPDFIRLRCRIDCASETLYMCLIACDSAWKKLADAEAAEIAELKRMAHA